MSKNNDLISIIVPVYNAEAIIERCVEGIKAQTYDNYEVILINDGSTDGTADILEKICADNEKYTVIAISNSGAGMARNRGIDSAKGNYICFIDIDDVAVMDGVGLSVCQVLAEYMRKNLKRAVS